MRLFLEDEGALDLKLPYEELATKVADAVLDYEKCPYEAQVELLLTMNEEIRQMNLEFRGIDRATDVLSFPMLDYEEAGNFDFLEDCAEAFDPESGELLLGDIMICAQKVKEQAEKYNHSEMREFGFLVAHSMLHLCGYDHMEPEDAVRMEARQREALDALGITR